MKILVMSDSHGKIKNCLDSFKNIKDIDLLVHLGDYEKDGERISKALGLDLISVKGNMDGQVEKEHKFLETPAGKILLTHGHMDGVKGDYLNLIYACKEEKAIAAFFGHTHSSFNENIDGVNLFNPGSTYNPRDGKAPSYGIVYASKEKISYEIHRFPSSSVKKMEGGFLRSKINYSDRF